MRGLLFKTAECGDNTFVTKEETILAPQEWLVFCNNVSGFRTDNTVSIYTNMMSDRDDDSRAILVLLETIMTFSSNTAVCERWFLCISLQVASIHTSLSSQLLESFVRIVIDGAPVQKVKTEDQVNSWIANSNG